MAARLFFESFHQALSSHTTAGPTNHRNSSFPTKNSPKSLVGKCVIHIEGKEQSGARMAAELGDVRGAEEEELRRRSSEIGLSVPTW